MNESGARLLQSGERAAVVDDAVGDGLVELVVGAAKGGLELGEGAVKVGAGDLQGGGNGVGWVIWRGEA
jgi:hypothetical protein